MPQSVDRRDNPRLRLSYPIRLSAGTEESRPLGRTVTHDLSARGAYFSTFHGAPYEVGREVLVEVTVPHRLAAGGREVTLDLRGAGRVVRVEAPARGLNGENGVPLTGVAIQFDRHLSFHYAWM